MHARRLNSQRQHEERDAEQRVKHALVLSDADGIPHKHFAARSFPK
jgi:hypothetical protein